MNTESIKRFSNLPLTLRVGAVAALLGPLGVIASYVSRFWHSGISSNPDDWARFGDYVGGTLGWLLSSIALIAVYVTYLKQQETDAEQKSHSEEKIGLLRQQTSQLQSQVEVTRQEAFDARLYGLFTQLIRSILACSREHNTMGTINGHAYFQQISGQVWSAYCEAENRGESDPWRVARNVLGTEEGNWTSVRGQIALQLGLIASSSQLDSSLRRQAMTLLTSQLSSGIAVLFAVDAFLAEDAQLIAAANEFGLFSAVAPHIRDALMEASAYAPSAFSVGV